jgi:hypothetical protein
MSKYLLIVIVNLLFVLSLFGQSNLIVEKQMPTVKGNKVKYRSVIFPNTLSDRLTKLLIAKGHEKNYDFQNTRLKRIFQKVPFLRVAEYFESGVVKNKDGSFTATIVSHPAFYPAIFYEDKLYVFSESEFKTDAEIFNLFLEKANLKIENEREAAELANLYFSVTRGYFENKGKLILSGVEDVPLSYRKDNESETKRLQEVITSPRTKMTDGSYEVELYTWEIALGEVKKWNFKIQPDAQVEVESTIIGKL